MHVRFRYFAATLTTVLVVLCAINARAQAYILLKGKEPIPREYPTYSTGASSKPYKSWSIFLVTSQDWLIPENARRLRDLYDRSQAFGRVIGEDHLAVWFWAKTVTHYGGEAMAEGVDVERAIAICKRLQLKPSGGPYLLFTTTYPDERVALTDYSVIELGSKAEDSVRILNRLGDQLVTEGVIRKGAFTQRPGSDDFWSAWFNATRHALAELGLGLRVAISTPTLSLENRAQR